MVLLLGLLVLLSLMELVHIMLRTLAFHLPFMFPSPHKDGQLTTSLVMKSLGVTFPRGTSGQEGEGAIKTHIWMLRSRGGEKRTNRDLGDSIRWLLVSLKALLPVAQEVPIKHKEWSGGDILGSTSHLPPPPPLPHHPLMTLDHSMVI